MLHVLPSLPQAASSLSLPFYPERQRKACQIIKKKSSISIPSSRTTAPVQQKKMSVQHRITFSLAICNSGGGGLDLSTAHLICFWVALTVMQSMQRTALHQNLRTHIGISVTYWSHILFSRSIFPIDCQPRGAREVDYATKLKYEVGESK